MNRYLIASLLAYGAVGCSEAPESFADAEPLGIGPYSVGSTNMEVAPEYAGIGDDAMHEVVPQNQDNHALSRTF